MICKVKLSRIINGITKAVENYPVTRCVSFTIIPQLDNKHWLEGELVSLSIELDGEDINDFSLLEILTNR